MSDEAEESALYIELLKGTVHSLQDRVNQEKKRRARLNMYSSNVYPYHRSNSTTFIKPTYPSRSLVFVNPKMNYTKVNSQPTPKAAATSLAAASSSSTSLYRKHPTVNRTVINNHKYNLTLKKEPLTNGVKTSTVAAPTSPQSSTSTASKMGNETSKGDVLKESNTVTKPKTLISCILQKRSTLGVRKVTLSPALSSKSVSGKPVLKNQVNSVSTAARTCTTSSTPKMSITSSSTPKMSITSSSTPKMSITSSSTPKMSITSSSTPKMSITSSSTPKMSITSSSTPKMSITSSSTPKMSITSSSTPKMSITRTYLPKSRNITLKVSPITNAASTSRFVERHRYKIVREHKPIIRKTVASTMSVTPVKSHTINTRFNLVKKPDVFMHKSGYSYVSKRCLQRAKVISLSNSEAGKSYVKKLGKLLIDAGKKLDKKPLVMMSRRKISRVPVHSTPKLPKRKSSMIPPKSKLKIDHRRIVYHNLNSSRYLISSLAAKHKLSPENQKKWFLGAKRFINNKFSKLQTVTVQGIKYRVEAGGKNLRRLNSGPRPMPNSKVSLIAKVSRIHIGGAIFTRTSTGVLKRVNTHKLIVANRAVNKSIATAVAKNRKVQSKPAQKPCLYFNNFGKCKNIKCPYIHDPKKIAVCRRMIQGTCKVLGCPFYHKLAKEKMPTCYYFLKGQCNRDNCIYPHVKVNKNAKTCEDFLNGYCSRGEKCTLKHFFLCQKFQENQVCSHNACKFKARQMNKAKMSSSANKRSDVDHGKKKKMISSVKNSVKKSSGKLVPSSEPIPITANLSFISLGNSSEDSMLDVSGEANSQSNSTVKEQQKETLRIRPRL